MIKPTEHLTAGQVTNRLMVSTKTDPQLAQRGILKSSLTSCGHRHYFFQHIKRLARQWGFNCIPQPAKQLRILVVDDDKQFAQYLVDLLEWYSEIEAVEVSHNGFDAGIKINDFKPHIVLLDLMMEDMDGFAVCKLVKSRPATRSIRVITMTGNYVESYIQRSLCYGAEACLAKPLNEAKLFELLGLLTKPEKDKTYHRY